MSDAADALSLAPSPSPQVAALRARIGTLCHALRLAGPAYAGWVLFTLVTHWSDAAGVAHGWGLFLKTDLGEIPAGQRAAGFAIHFVVWIFVALACLNLWMLFTAFLKGRSSPPKRPVICAAWRSSGLRPRSRTWSLAR